MTPTPNEIIEAARVQAGMTFDELWLAYVGLGGSVAPDVLRAYLGGSTAQLVGYDVLALAINERFVDQGGDHPVPYSDDL